MIAIGDYRVLKEDFALFSGEVIFVTLFFIVLYIVLRSLFRKADSVYFMRKYREGSKVVMKKSKIIILFMYIILISSVVGYNGYLIYKNIGLYDNAVYILSKIPDGFWTSFAVGLAKVTLVYLLASFLVRVVSKILNNLEVKAKLYEDIVRNNEIIGIFFERLRRVIKNGAVFLVAIYAMKKISMPNIFLVNMYIVLKIYLILSGGYLLSIAATVFVDGLEDLSKKYWYRKGYMDWHRRLHNLLPLFKRCLEYAIYIWVASLVMLQIGFFAKYVPFAEAIVKIIGIFFVARVFVELLKLFIDKYMGSADATVDKQRQTLVPIIKSISQTVVYFISFLLMLGALDINPMPILAGAGIFGLVVGMGAQPLINDVVSGIFILFESIFLVGDYIETGSVRGEVEEIFLRTTKVRDPNGQLHILRNGQINEVENYSKGYALAVVEVGVAYDSDLEHVYRVLQDIGRKVKEKNPSVLEGTVVNGIKEFGESELLIRTVTKVRPGDHLKVSFDIRNMIKNEFDVEGIEIPFARRVLIFKDQAADKQKEGQL